MRTPKHKKVMQKARNTATNKLRKKAMRNKMVKKTLLEVGGDDTREDVRDLMNDSDMSFNGVDLKEQTEKQNSEGPSNVIEPEPEKSMSRKVSGMMTKSLSMVTMKTNETTDKLANGIMKKTKSLRSLRNKRKHSNEENMESAQDVSVTEEKKPKIEDVKEPLEDAQKVNIPGLTMQEQAFAKFAGVKNMLSSAVWGVPYAKVVEDPLDISVCDSEMMVGDSGVKDESKTGENPNNCVIA